MRPIIFVRVADMKYYQGVTERDVPSNGGAYVKETGYAHECYNFAPVIEEGEDHEKCLGFFMMTGGRGADQLHIEKIPGCEKMNRSEKCEDVIVVFVSKANGSKSMRVVGFYRNATVYRYRHYMELDGGYEQEYLFEAKKDGCVVLPYQTRFGKKEWYVPNASSKCSDFGFGRSNVWYAGAKGASKKELEYVENMIAAIDSYSGENWMEKGGNV